MSTVAEILKAIDKLPPRERCELESRLRPPADDAWERQMREDLDTGGKLSELRTQAELEAKTGKLREFPEQAPL